MNSGGRDLTVKFTVKELIHPRGNRIYSIEAMDLEGASPAGQLDNDTSKDAERKSPIAGDASQGTQSDGNGQAQFSLASRSLASVAESVISKWANRPEWRDSIIKTMRERLGKLRRDGDWRVSFGKAWQRQGDDAVMAGNRTEESIATEIPMREALRADELEMEGMGKLEDWVLMAYDRGSEKLRDDRVISALLDKGRLLSRTEARRRGKITVDGKETGDYDGSPRLPAFLPAC
jgi:hypothetical protein